LRQIVNLGLRGLWRVYRRATRIVAVSDGVADEIARLAGLPPGAVTTVYNPIVDDSLAERAKAPLVHPWLEPGQPPVLLAVGCLWPQKDYPTLLEDFAIARKSRPLRPVILGRGPVRSKLQDMTVALGVAPDVHLFDYAENPIAWMARASLLVLSSVYEGLPAVLIEALACGCPAVSTDCPSGPSEILDKGTSGRLVPCRDPAALAASILATLDEPVERQWLRDAARTFDSQRSIDRYLSIFEDATARHRSDLTARR
jgi:glycosyltransferase involved in cell wall biosynthesis